MIKKFKDFDIKDIKENEMEFFEKELNSRKKMREDMFLDKEYKLDDIKDFIIKEINNNEDYTINVGKKVGFFNKNEMDEIHIEYKSTNIGTVKIYKPKDESDEGYFNVNGKMYETNADDVRNFYHYLTQQLKKNKIIKKNIKY